jgi:hypothetical protein
MCHDILVFREDPPVFFLFGRVLAFKPPAEFSGFTFPPRFEILTGLRTIQFQDPFFAAAKWAYGTVLGRARPFAFSFITYGTFHNQWISVKNGFIPYLSFFFHSTHPDLSATPPV